MNCYPYGKQHLVGENHYAAKLSNSQVEEIKGKYIPYKYGVRKLAKEYKVSKSHIHHIVIGIKRKWD